MKRSRNVLISLLLAALISLSCVLPAFAVTLPAGVSESAILAALPKTDAAVKNLVAADGKGSLRDLLAGELLSDKTLNMIFKGLYGELTQQSSAMQVLGIDLRLQTVKGNLYNYPEVQAAIGENTDWSAVLNDGFSPRWNLQTSDDLAIALDAILRPLRELLFTLLCGGTYQVNLLLGLNGANGYENAVLPLYRALGVRSFESQEDFTAGAKADRSHMVNSIVSVLFGVIDSLAAAPVTELTSRLPGIADYLQNDGLKTALTTLLEPLKIRVAVFQLSGVDSLLENMGLSDLDLSTLMQGLDVGALLGTNEPLTLPELDLAAVAACGTRQGDYYEGNKAQCFTVLARWLLDAARANKRALASGMGGDAAVLDRFLAKSNDELIKLLLDLMNTSPGQTHLDVQWTFPAYTPGSVPMTPTLTEENYAKMLSGIDATLNDFLSEFTEDGTLSDLISSKLYSSALVTTLMKAVYGALYSDETAGAMSLLGVPASPAGVADAVASRYPSVANALRRYSSWDRVPDDGFFWLSPGSRAGFFNAVTAVLTPLRPMLTMLLAEGSVQVLGAVTVYGSNGYNNAVIPVLEALGCAPETIRSYDEYKSTAAGPRAITDILEPVASLLDRLIEAPVATICEILPNALYFMRSGGLETAVGNLLQPVKTLLEKLGMSDLLPTDLGASFGEIDLNELLQKATAGADVQLTLPEPDLDLVMSLGTAETVVSKRTYQGAAVNATHIRANAPQVLLTLLRYVVGALGDEKNSEVLSGMLQQDPGDGTDMIAVYTAKITEQLKTMTTDETVEWLYNLLFSETPKRDESLDNREIPTIVYRERKDHTARNRAILITLAVVFIIALALVLSRVNFGDMRERRRFLRSKRKAASDRLKNAAAVAKAKKAEERQKAAAAKKAPPAPAEPAPPATPPEETRSANPWNFAPASRPAPQGAEKKPFSLVDPLAPKREARPAAPAAPAEAPVDEAPTPTKKELKNRLAEEERIIKEKIREEKARNKACRKTQKADKSNEAGKRGN